MPLATALPLNPEGADFLRSTARRCLLTIQAASLAARRSPRGAGRSAMAVVGEESRLLTGVSDLAARHDGSLPSAPDASGRAELARLGQLSGSAFDQAYERCLHTSERAALRSFAAAADSAQQTSAIRVFASAQLSRLQARLAQARSASIPC